MRDLFVCSLGGKKTSEVDLIWHMGKISEKTCQGRGKGFKTSGCHGAESLAIEVGLEHRNANALLINAAPSNIIRRAKINQYQRADIMRIKARSELNASFLDKLDWGST